MRGTIGGAVGSNLTPVDIVEMTAAYGTWLLSTGKESKVIIGRDGRISGQIVSDLACNTLLSLGIDVIDLGLSTTPTVEMIVPHLNAGGGIIFTASHNPKEWNALKLLNDKGEFISKKEGEEIMRIASQRSFNFVDVENLGGYSKNESAIDYHIQKIFELEYIDIEAVSNRRFKVVVDCINSTGAISIPPLLEGLNCDFHLINEELTGDFAHNPEPLAINLTGISQVVKERGADLGIAVDPDVDRLVFVSEDGNLFGEEYSLVAIADYILKQKKGPTVSNFSSTRALADLSEKYGCAYYASAVGEVHVVEKMKEHKAVIGGEGNGGIILPDLHYGRDALVGIAIMLSFLAKEKTTLSQLKSRYSDYTIIKSKLKLDPDFDFQAILNNVKNVYLEEKINETDGLKIDFVNGWVHLRKSNTEPIVRLIAEARDADLAEKLINNVKVIINGKR